MNIRVCVYLNESAKLSNNRLFERIVSSDDSLRFPYSNVLDSMKVLFGKNCIISFEVQ